MLGVFRLHGLLSDSWDRGTPSSCIKKYILSLPTLQTVWRNFEIGSGDAHSGGVIVEIQCRVLDSIRKSFRITECAGSRALHRARSTISVNTHGSIVSALIQDVVNASSKLSIDSLPTALQAELYACLVTVIAAICVGYDGSTKESFSLSRQIRINPVPNSTSGSTQSRLVCLISMLQAIDPEAGEKQIWPQLRKQLLSDASVDQDSRIADILASSELAFLPTRYKSISSEPRSPASKRRRLLDPTAVPLVEKYTQLVNRLSVLLGLPHVGSIESIKDYYK